MPRASRGEVWQVDLGIVAKARPAVVVSIPFHDDEHAVYAIVPPTTALRGGRFEVQVSVRWLHSGAFDVQGMRNRSRIRPAATPWRVGACTNGSDSARHKDLAGNLMIRSET